MKQRAVIIAWDPITGLNTPFEALLTRNSDPTYQGNHGLVEDVSKAMGEADLEDQDRYKMTSLINGPHTTLIEWELNGVRATTQIVWLKDGERLENGTIAEYELTDNTSL